MGFKLKGTLMAIPSLAVRQTIIAGIEAEQALVSANRELANRMGKRFHLPLAECGRKMFEICGGALMPPTIQKGFMELSIDWKKRLC